AAEAWNEAYKLRKELFLESPMVVVYAEAAADSLDRLTLVHLNAGRAKEAEEHARMSVQLYEGMILSFPHVPQYRFGMAVCRYNLGLALALAGRNVDAATENNEALRLAQQLVDQSQDVTEYRELAATCFTGQARLHRAGGRLPQTRKAYEGAAAVQKTLVRDVPDVVKHRWELAKTLFDLATVLVEDHQFSEAEDYFRQAQAEYQALL